MTKLQQVLTYLGIAAVAVTAGLLLRAQLATNAPSPETVEGAARNTGADAIFAASLPDLQGVTQPISQWRGKVVVVNFWATWCEPCREEIPEFIKLQRQFGDQGLVFVGIAVDDRERVAAFSREIGINYPVLVGDLQAMKLAGTAGNRQGALPFTAIIDRNGSLIGTKLGRLSHSKLEAMIRPLL